MQDPCLCRGTLSTTALKKARRSHGCHSNPASRGQPGYPTARERSLTPSVPSPTRELHSPLPCHFPEGSCQHRQAVVPSQKRLARVCVGQTGQGGTPSHSKRPPGTGTQPRALRGGGHGRAGLPTPSLPPAPACLLGGRQASPSFPP